MIGLVAACLIISATPAISQDMGASCTSAEHAEFDFWLGDWEVHTVDQQLAGTNRITKVHGGCVLREEWTASGGGTGGSYNIYDSTRGTWHQTWVDDQGNLLLLDGGLDARGRMVLRGERPGDDDVTITDEISWELNEDGTVTQVWSTSTDAGATWRELFHGVYRKK
ncbi:MAG: hypothetical protein M8835_00835 [marine benthic group bacterium]|nr:hypothetical protein [Gemmatimonadota bacterium]MCL7973085.1 hypothetical protein [Gemmatimonadota bacterium]MCL7976412.1 hypothetical protein [Gemmatimonadota bacterium]MCL7978929.1 hypothetical protein [Gemmatimonadota bacterium]